MYLPCWIRALRLLFCIALASSLSLSVWGQETPQKTAEMPPAPAPQSNRPQAPFHFADYSKPVGYFPNPLAPYQARSAAPPVLDNAPLMNTLLQDGKLMLSLNDAIALALENNLDIAIARYNLPIADTDIMLANAGQSTRGVNTGVVQGTPGGGVSVTSVSGSSTSGSQGGGAGGTSAGAGGAGSGSSGLVTSTLGVGAPIPSFDPFLSGTLQIDRNSILCTSIFCGPNQNTSTANFSYNQGFHWGTNLSVGFNNSRLTTNSPVTSFSPSLTSNFRLTLSQPLLQGFGILSNTRFIRIAKNNREISDVAFRLQVITTINQIENIYWDLVSAYENVRVQQDSLALAQRTLSDTQKQVQIGTLAPIEVVRAQSTVATNQQNLIVAQTNLQLQQLLMKNALSRTLVDPRLADAEVIPTSTMVVPQNEEIQPVQDLINDALSHRAELVESRIDLSNRELTRKTAKNALLPTLSLFAYYGGSGIGGAQNPAATCNNPQNPPEASGFCIPPGRLAGNSYAGTLGDLVDSSAPDKGVGLTLSIPIRNRAAQANQVRSELEYRQSQMRLLQLENQVRIEVRNAQFSVQQNRAAVAAAQAAVTLAQQSLDAEQKKYALGASTSTLVLQNSTSLTQAESALVSAKAAYEKSRVELDRSTGLLLDHNGILLSDAISGSVTHMPNVPYAVPRQDVQSAPMPKQPGTMQQPQAVPQATPPPTTPPPANQPPSR
jgi:outer membrane protein